MSINKTDTINALCVAHQITQYEVPPPEKYIRITYKNKTLKIAAHILIQASYEVINLADRYQRTPAEVDQRIALMGGWKTTPTPVLTLIFKNEYITEYNPLTDVINKDWVLYGCHDHGAFFGICKRGKEYRHVKNLNDTHYITSKDQNEILISIRTNANFTYTFREDLAEELGDEAITLMDYIIFDKNMRLVAQIPAIDGWEFEIKYFNYDVPRPVKRQKTS